MMMQDANSSRPSLVVTDAPPPEVIYRAGSHDTVLSNNSGSTGNYGRLDTGHIETIVTQKANDLRLELAKLNENTDNAKRQFTKMQAENDVAAADYYATVAAISTELQAGTTRGNPILVDRWNVAQGKLNALAQDTALINDLASDLGNQASRAAFLLEATQNAFALSGAVPEDHKKLTVIQDGVERSVSDISRMLSKVNDEISRRATYLQSERANLQTLSLGIANGELYGKNLTNSLFRKAAGGDKSLFKGGTPMSDSGLGAGPAAPGGARKPLVIIRFDRPGVNFEQPLYTAVNQAMEKYPAAKFDLVAVSNMEGNAADLALSSAEARKNGEAVLRSLEKMGLPLERIRLSAASSKSVVNSEVHLYLQ